MVNPEPSERLCDADHSIRSRMLTQLREGIRSHPDTYLIGCDGTPAVCRICWGEEEEDDSEDGYFIEPCKCSGSSRFVHARCLGTWMKNVSASRGPSFALRCDICRTGYRLPASLGVRDNVGHHVRRVCAENYQRALASRAGPFLRVCLKTASMYCALNGLYSSALQSLSLPAIFLEARYDPITALKPLIPRYLAAMLLEPLLSTHDLYFHVETAIFYAFGWILDASARRFERLAMPTLDALPTPVQLAAAALFSIPKGLGLVFQALDLTLMVLYGGGMAGFLEGGLELASAPFKILSLAAKGGAGFLGFLATALAKGGQAALHAAHLIAGSNSTD